MTKEIDVKNIDQVLQVYYLSLLLTGKTFVLTKGDRRLLGIIDVMNGRNESPQDFCIDAIQMFSASNGFFIKGI